MACERDFLKAFIPILFATAALFMGLLGNFYCETIAFEATDAETINFGVWNYKDFEVVTKEPNNRVVVRETCFNYPQSTNFDAKWRTAKAFSIITPIIGGVCLFWAWLSPCFYVGLPRWKKLGCVFLTMTLFQGLTLLLLDSNACKNNNALDMLAEDGITYQTPCTFGWGTKVNIAAVVCWFVAGVIMMTACIPPPTRPEHPVETQTVTYTQTEQPDGTKVVTENVVKGEYVPPEKQVDAGGSEDKPAAAAEP